MVLKISNMIKTKLNLFEVIRLKSTKMFYKSAPICGVKMIK